jgi:hypothetical protein
MPNTLPISQFSIDIGKIMQIIQCQDPNAITFGDVCLVTMGILIRELHVSDIFLFNKEYYSGFSKNGWNEPNVEELCRHKQFDKFSQYMKNSLEKMNKNDKNRNKNEKFFTPKIMKFFYDNSLLTLPLVYPDHFPDFETFFDRGSHIGVGAYSAVIAVTKRMGCCVNYGANKNEKKETNKNDQTDQNDEENYFQHPNDYCKYAAKELPAWTPGVFPFYEELDYFRNYFRQIKKHNLQVKNDSFGKNQKNIFSQNNATQFDEKSIRHSQYIKLLSDTSSPLHCSYQPNQKMLNEQDILNTSNSLICLREIAAFIFLKIKTQINPDFPGLKNLISAITICEILPINGQQYAHNVQHHDVYDEWGNPVGIMPPQPIDQSMNKAQNRISNINHSNFPLRSVNNNNHNHNNHNNHNHNNNNNKIIQNDHFDELDPIAGPLFGHDIRRFVVIMPLFSHSLQDLFDIAHSSLPSPDSLEKINYEGLNAIHTEQIIQGINQYGFPITTDDINNIPPGGGRIPNFNHFSQKIFKNVLLGLNFLHKNNIMHRDIKPNNILIDQRTGNIVLADFGSCKYYTAGNNGSKFCGKRLDKKSGKKNRKNKNSPQTSQKPKPHHLPPRQKTKNSNLNQYYDHLDRFLAFIDKFPHTAFHSLTSTYSAPFGNALYRSVDHLMMSPSAHRVNIQATDVHAFGCIMFQMLLGSQFGTFPLTLYHLPTSNVLLPFGKPGSEGVGKILVESGVFSEFERVKFARKFHVFFRVNILRRILKGKMDLFKKYLNFGLEKFIDEKSGKQNDKKFSFRGGEPLKSEYDVFSEFLAEYFHQCDRKQLYMDTKSRCFDINCDESGKNHKKSQKIEKNNQKIENDSSENTPKPLSFSNFEKYITKGFNWDLKVLFHAYIRKLCNTYFLFCSQKPLWRKNANFKNFILSKLKKCRKNQIQKKCSKNSSKNKNNLPSSRLFLTATTPVNPHLTEYYKGLLPSFQDCFQNETYDILFKHFVKKYKKNTKKSQKILKNTILQKNYDNEMMLKYGLFYSFNCLEQINIHKVKSNLLNKWTDFLISTYLYNLITPIANTQPFRLNSDFFNHGNMTNAIGDDCGTKMGDKGSPQKNRQKVIPKFKGVNNNHNNNNNNIMNDEQNDELFVQKNVPIPPILPQSFIFEEISKWPGFMLLDGLLGDIRDPMRLSYNQSQSITLSRREVKLLVSKKRISQKKSISLQKMQKKVQMYLKRLGKKRLYRPFGIFFPKTTQIDSFESIIHNSQPLISFSTFFSDSERNLLNWMLSLLPIQRPTVETILEHEYFSIKYPYNDILPQISDQNVNKNSVFCSFWEKKIKNLNQGKQFDNEIGRWIFSLTQQIPDSSRFYHDQRYSYANFFYMNQDLVSLEDNYNNFKPPIEFCDEQKNGQNNFEQSLNFDDSSYAESSGKISIVDDCGQTRWVTFQEYQHISNQIAEKQHLIPFFQQNQIDEQKMLNLNFNNNNFIFENEKNFGKNFEINLFENNVKNVLPDVTTGEELSLTLQPSHQSEVVNSSQILSAQKSLEIKKKNYCLKEQQQNEEKFEKYEKDFFEQNYQYNQTQTRKNFKNQQNDQGDDNNRPHLSIPAHLILHTTHKTPQNVQNDQNNHKIDFLPELYPYIDPEHLLYLKDFIENDSNTTNDVIEVVKIMYENIRLNLIKNDSDKLLNLNQNNAGKKRTRKKEKFLDINFGQIVNSNFDPNFKPNKYQVCVQSNMNDDEENHTHCDQLFPNDQNNPQNLINQGLIQQLPLEQQSNGRQYQHYQQYQHHHQNDLFSPNTSQNDGLKPSNQNFQQSYQKPSQQSQYSHQSSHKSPQYPQNLNYFHPSAQIKPLFQHTQLPRHSPRVKRYLTTKQQISMIPPSLPPYLLKPKVVEVQKEEKGMEDLSIPMNRLDGIELPSIERIIELLRGRGLELDGDVTQMGYDICGDGLGEVDAGDDDKNVAQITTTNGRLLGYGDSLRNGFQNDDKNIQNVENQQEIEKKAAILLALKRNLDNVDADYTSRTKKHDDSTGTSDFQGIVINGVDFKPQSNNCEEIIIEEQIPLDPNNYAQNKNGKKSNFFFLKKNFANFDRDIQINSEEIHLDDFMGRKDVGLSNIQKRQEDDIFHSKMALNQTQQRISNRQNFERNNHTNLNAQKYQNNSKDECNNHNYNNKHNNHNNHNNNKHNVQMYEHSNNDRINNGHINTSYVFNVDIECQTPPMDDLDGEKF